MGRSRGRRLCGVQAGSEGLQSCSRAYSARDVCTDTIDTVSENSVGCELARSKQSPSAIAIDGHTSFLHADIDQDFFAEPPEESELCEDEVWKQHKALYGYREAPKLWHQHVVTLSERLNYHPLLTDRSCFRNDDLDINIFIHVADGLLFGQSIENLRLVEDLSNQVMMHTVGRLERQRDQHFFLGRVIVRTARGYSVEANPKHTRDVTAVLGLVDSTPVATPSVKRTPTTESLVELENEKRAVHRTAARKLLYIWQERAVIMYSVEETARKILSTNQQFVGVHTDSDWAGQPLSTSGGVVQLGSEAELYALTPGIAEGMMGKHLLRELGHEVTLVNHVDSLSAKALASKRRLGRMKHVVLKYMFLQDVVEKKEEANDSCMCQHEVEQGRLDGKMPYF